MALRPSGQIAVPLLLLRPRERGLNSCVKRLPVYTFVQGGAKEAPHFEFKLD